MAIRQIFQKRSWLAFHLFSKCIFARTTIVISFICMKLSVVLLSDSKHLFSTVYRLITFFKQYMCYQYPIKCQSKPENVISIKNVTLPCFSEVTGALSYNNKKSS